MYSNLVRRRQITQLLRRGPKGRAGAAGRRNNSRNLPRRIKSTLRYLRNLVKERENKVKLLHII